MRTVNVHDAKTHLSQLIDCAHAGEEIILAKAGKPYARLVALAPIREPGGLSGHVGDAFFDPLPPSELASWNDPA